MKHQKKLASLVAVMVCGIVVSTAAAADGLSPGADQFLAAAQVYDNEGSVSYVGDSWGPTPIWRLDLRPYLDMTIDVASVDGTDVKTNCLDDIADYLWAQAGSPPPVSNPAPTVTVSPPVTVTPVVPSVDSTSTDDSAATTVPAVTPSTSLSEVAQPQTPISTGTVYAPIQIYVGSVAAKQPTVASTLTKALGERVTLAASVKTTLGGKKVSLTRIKVLLSKKHSVRVTLKAGTDGFVVTGIAA